MKVEAAVIGGTGIGSRLFALPGLKVHVPTPYGTVRGKAIVNEGKTILVLSRHSAGHKVPPHRVSYLGLASACLQLGARACFSTAAVGSLRRDWAPGTFALCQDFVDLSARNITAFDRTVKHVDFSDPFDTCPSEALRSAASNAKVDMAFPCTYLNLNGPRYETPVEVKMLAQIGDVVGMTAGSEAIAMREIGVPYACMAIITNLAAGISENPLSHQEVEEAMNLAGERAVRLLLSAACQVG